MRKALVIGIDYYAQFRLLAGCVNNARAVAQRLERHEDGSVNFGVKRLTARTAGEEITRNVLRDQIEQLFAGEGEVALLYFAGHGTIDVTGGYLCSSEVRSINDGVSLAEVMTLANRSRIRNRLVVLDSCHSGVTGGTALQPNVAEMCDGVTVLTAATAEQEAVESSGSGVFTGLLIDALDGAAANLVGDVTPGSVYAHIDQSLGPWAQRPVFKTNVSRFVSLRRVEPAIPLADLRRISTLFPEKGVRYALDPTYEPERDPSWATDPRGIPAPDPAHTAIFAILQRYNRAGLLVPDGAPHLWHAAMQRAAVRLTPLGEHYRQLAARGLI